MSWIIWDQVGQVGHGISTALYTWVHKWNWPHTLVAMFLTDQIRFSFYCWSHPVITSTNLFWILTTAFREDFYVFVTAMSYTPWWPCFLTGKGSFSYFCSYLVTISAKLFSILPTGFRRRFLKFSHRYIMETGHASWRPCFWRIKFVLAIFVGHQVLISTKLFWILTPGFRDLQSFVTAISHVPWRQISFS